MLKSKLFAYNLRAHTFFSPRRYASSIWTFSQDLGLWVSPGKYLWMECVWCIQFPLSIAWICWVSLTKPLVEKKNHGLLDHYKTFKKPLWEGSFCAGRPEVLGDEETLNKELWALGGPESGSQRVGRAASLLPWLQPQTEPSAPRDTAKSQHSTASGPLSTRPYPLDTDTTIQPALVFLTALSLWWSLMSIKSFFLSSSALFLWQLLEFAFYLRCAEILLSHAQVWGFSPSIFLIW